jgi:hypothetical protein
MSVLFIHSFPEGMTVMESHRWCRLTALPDGGPNIRYAALPPAPR